MKEISNDKDYCVLRDNGECTLRGVKCTDRMCIRGSEANMYALSKFTADQREKEDANESRKDDVKDNKPMWHLFPFAELSGVVNVYTAGAKKYGENRWQNLEDGERRYFAASCRHWVEHLRGNEIDPEDGCLHIDKVIWNMIAVRHCFLVNKGIDPNTTDYSKLYDKDNHNC